MSKPHRTLIELDFTEYDTIEAAKMLQSMAAGGEIKGMLFAVQLTRQQHGRRFMLGASGRAANDATVATWLASILHFSVAQQAHDE